MVRNIAHETFSYRWLEHLRQTIGGGETLQGNEMISWAAYHANSQASTLPQNSSELAISSLLPLYREDSKSVAMIRHAMDVVKAAVDVVNPGQVPIIACVAVSDAIKEIEQLGIDQYEAYMHNWQCQSSTLS